MNWLYVFVGGGVGSVLRYAVSLFVKARYSGELPAATLISNVLSCLVLGLVINYMYHRQAEGMLKYLLIIGLCGGFSTFSTFSYETLALFKAGNMMWAVLNILINTGLCIGVLYFLSTKLQP